MKNRSTFLLILIISLAIILFFYLKEEKTVPETKPVDNEKNKVIQKPKPVEKSIEIKPKEPELKLTLEPEKNFDKSKYEKNEDYQEAIPLGEAPVQNKQKDLDIDVGVDVNKEKRSVEGVELNIQKKF